MLPVHVLARQATRSEDTTYARSPGQSIARSLRPRSQYHALAHTGAAAEPAAGPAGESAGTSTGTADTVLLYRTGAGRKVRGGGGIAPDIATPGPPAPPRWWSALIEDAHPQAVADSVAAALPAGRTAAGWMADLTRWEEVLLPPLLSRVQEDLEVETRL